YSSRVLTRGLSNRPKSGTVCASLACQDLTRRYVCPAPGGSGCTLRFASADARAGHDPASRRRFMRHHARTRVTTDHGVTLTAFLDQTTDIAPTRPDLDPEATAADLASLELETAADDLLAEAAAVTPETVLPKPAATVVRATPDADPDAEEPEENIDHDLLDIEDSTRLYLREIARVPLLTAEEEVMLAKTMELGKRIETDPASAVVDLHVWGVNDTEPKARTKHPRYPHRFAAESARIVR